MLGVSRIITSLALGSLMLGVANVSAQQVAIPDVTVQVGQSADKSPSFTAGATPATGVQIDMSFADYDDFDTIQLFATDFTGDEQTCGVAGVLLSATLQVSCGIHPSDPNGFRIQLRDVTNGDLPSLPEYMTVRISAEGSATATTVAVTNTVRYFDNVGTGFGDETITSEVEIVEGPPAVLDVDPLSIPFGNVRVNETSSEAPIAICNDGEAGAADLTITSITPSPAQFNEGDGSTCNDTLFDLAPGDCCNYHVTFSPDAEEGFSGRVAIESSEGNATVGLSGQGTVSDANLMIDPTSHDFGELDINADAVCETFALQNSAAEDPLNITEVSLGGMLIARGLAAAAFSIGADSCSDADLAPGGSCSVEVCFDPDSEGPFSDQLVVTSTANDVSADLEGVGTATADLVVTPSFGPVNLGFGLQGDTITANGNIVNNGSADAVVQCDLVDENDPPVFSTTLPLSELVTVEAGADPITFEVSCALPEDAEDGDTFDGQIQCDVERGGVSDATTHFLTCGVSEFEPLPVPTMSNWSIALFALLMLLVGGISIRFFRT